MQIVGAVIAFALSCAWAFLKWQLNKLERAATDATIARDAVETLQEQWVQMIKANVKLEPESKE